VLGDLLENGINLSDHPAIQAGEVR